jgi:hypothetical protein
MLMAGRSDITPAEDPDTRTEIRAGRHEAEKPGEDDPEIQVIGRRRDPSVTS